MYQRLIGQVERFRDIAKNMKIVQKETPELALDMLTLQFQAVQAGLGHMDIREFRKLAIEDPTRFEGLSREVAEIVDEGDAGEPEPDAPIQEDLFVGADPDTPEDAPPPPSPSFPRTRVKRALDIAVEARKSRQRNDPELALRGAAERLGEVTPAQVAVLLAGAAATSTRAALAKIRAWVASVDNAS